MRYGMIKKLLTNEYKEFDDTVLIESFFVETTRQGRQLQYVLLGLTSKSFIIASEHRSESVTNDSNQLNGDVLEIVSLYPFESLTLSIFKRSKRKLLKASFINNSTRYFELGVMPKNEIFWNLWYIFILELNSSKKLWPFSCRANITKINSNKADNHQLHRGQFCNEDEVENDVCWRKWTYKHLYLGTRREIEDKDRPVPVLGLGPADELNLFYLKPRYFGMWEQSEHWVQCGNCSSECIGLHDSVIK